MNLADPVVVKMNRKNCDTKSQLLEQYQIAAEAYSKAVAELTRNIGKVDRVKHDKLSLAAEKTRLATAQARNGLDAHITQHGC